MVVLWDETNTIISNNPIEKNGEKQKQEGMVGKEIANNDNINIDVKFKNDIKEDSWQWYNISIQHSCQPPKGKKVIIKETVVVVVCSITRNIKPAGQTFQKQSIQTRKSNNCWWIYIQLNKELDVNSMVVYILIARYISFPMPINGMKKYEHPSNLLLVSFSCMR